MSRFQMNRKQLNDAMKELEVRTFEQLSDLFLIKTGFPVKSSYIRESLCKGAGLLSVQLSARIHELKRICQLEAENDSLKRRLGAGNEK